MDIKETPTFQVGVFSLNDLFTELMGFYGPQGWWPDPLEDIRSVSRGGEFQLLNVAFGTILVQNTAWTNASMAVRELFERTAFDCRTILNISTSELVNSIKQAGFQNQKAKKIQIFAEFYQNKKQDLYSASLLEQRKMLLALWGIGPESADTILLYGLERKSFIIDAYTKRILSRLGTMVSNNVKRYEHWQDYIQKQFKRTLEDFQEYHALIIEHGKQFCRKKPNCVNCPFNDRCIYGKYQYKDQ